MANPNPTLKIVEHPMSEDEHTSQLWESLDMTIESFTGARGAAVLHHARLRGMKPLDLTNIELTGNLASEFYPIIHFAGEDPKDSFTFSPQGGFRRTEFASPAG